MEQSPKQDRRWAGEPLWEGSSTAGRNVVVSPAEGGRFEAVGHAGGQVAFDVSLREEQLFRFRREMERAGAMLEGLPAWTEPGPRDEPVRRPPRGPRGPIGSDGSQEPPTSPTTRLMPQVDLSSRSDSSQEPPGPALLLADAETRRPVLPPEALGGGAVASAPALTKEERLPGPRSLRDRGGNPNDLARQRWGVIAPQGRAGDELLEAAGPLIAARAEEQGAQVRVERVATKGGLAEANEWVRTVYNSEALDEEERPAYLLILGDLPEVSAELQQRLSCDAFVGRLCFDDPAGYRAYVEKVLRQEKAPPKQDARALFFTTHDGSSATSVGYDALVTPALEACDRVPRRDFPVREVLEVGSPDDWSAPQLLGAVRDGGPGVLFTLSHGLALPRGRNTLERRRALQGAMAFGAAEPLAASQVATGPFLPGGAWFFLACLSAGTPSRSAYRPWLERLKADDEYGGRVADVLDTLPGDGEAPFIAALPRAALANPEGPLAIIGHLDLAWTYSFLDAYGSKRPSRFVEVMKQLWAGRRAGAATNTLLRQASGTESELLGLAQADAELQPGQPPPPEAVQRGHLWMARNDLAGYLLLGDPAVRVAPARG